MDLPVLSQRDQGRLENWAHGKLMRFYKTKYKVLHMDQGNPGYTYKLGEEIAESSLAKDLTVLVNKKLDMSR